MRCCVGKNGARAKAVALNAGLIFSIKEDKPIVEGVRKAESILREGSSFGTLEKWVQTQNRDPQSGLRKLEALCG